VTIEFWNNRANLGIKAGTQDLIGKELEIRAIEKHVKDGMTVLDAGCGNGITALELASRYEVRITGVDFSPVLITDAVMSSVDAPLVGLVNFMVCDLNSLAHSFVRDRFDLIYTERAIINLPDWDTQKRVIESLGNMLVPNGMYLMCECSQDGLDRLNSLRLKVNLPVIISPSHDLYIQEGRLDEVDLELDWDEDFSSTYYFISRVLNSWQAMQAGVEPDYDAPINRLALSLPPIGDVGQVKLWAWR